MSLRAACLASALLGAVVLLSGSELSTAVDVALLATAVAVGALTGYRALWLVASGVGAPTLVGVAIVVATSGANDSGSWAPLVLYVALLVFAALAVAAAVGATFRAVIRRATSRRASD